jgi:hypothetical protein
MEALPMRARSATTLALLATLALSPTALAKGAGATASGGGSFLFGAAIPMQFGFAAVAHGNGSASGSFHHAYSDGTFSYQLWGTVTCLTHDAAAGRAWIGGVLTKIRTDDPAPGIGPGDDAWFRVLDAPDGDRSTSMGFVGAIESSAAYCAMQIWPDDNARTHPVTEGQITLRVE